MTADKFRKLALSLPEASENAHMGHPDFRVGGKIFATIGAKEDSAMVKLSPIQQESLVSDWPDVFYPANGAWGVKGATMIRLNAGKESTVKQALITAWRNTAPKALVAEYDQK